MINKIVIALKPFLDQYFIEIVRKKIENYTILCYHTIKLKQIYLPFQIVHFHREREPQVILLIYHLRNSEEKLTGFLKVNHG